MRKYWFGIDEKVRFAIMASVNMALRFMIFSGLASAFFSGKIPAASGGDMVCFVLYCFCFL